MGNLPVTTLWYIKFDAWYCIIPKNFLLLSVFTNLWSSNILCNHRSLPDFPFESPPRARFPSKASEPILSNSLWFTIYLCTVLLFIGPQWPVTIWYSRVERRKDSDWLLNLMELNYYKFLILSETCDWGKRELCIEMCIKLVTWIICVGTPYIQNPGGKRK